MNSIKEYINNLRTVHDNSLNEESQMVEMPPTNPPLHRHQKSVIKRMETLERDSIDGYLHQNGERIFSNYGILGDSVGVGKSLMVLGHISRIPVLPPLISYNSIHQSSTSTFFSIKTNTYSDISEAGCLIIIPHTLFRQWSDYIQKQTTLTNMCIARLSQLTDNSINTILNSQVVLISNTLSKSLAKVCKNIQWKRVFIDEADTIHLSGISLKAFPARFYWFVTASWINLLYLNTTLYFDKNYINTHILGENTVYPYLKAHFKSRISQTYYHVESMRTKSHSLLREIISMNHPMRAHAVIKCSNEYIQKSISLPLLHRQVIYCRAPLTHDIIRSAVLPNIQQMLHAGDTEAALNALGVKGQTTKALIETVTLNLQKELERLERTYAYKESLEYSSAQVKVQALAQLTEKIEKTRQSIQGIEQRIKNSENDICPICYEEPQNKLITPCCSRIFCTSCLLFSLAVKQQCPLCRGEINPSSCMKIITGGNEIVNSEAKEDLPPRKNEALMQILKENPTGKFLVFSRYDNPFESIETTINDTTDIRIKYLKGNKDAISATLRGFESGKFQCLLLNSQFAGAGLNITAATHVILLHAMTHEEEKQILGRAYRVGRQGPLTFIKLLNKDEENYIEDESSTV